MRNYMEITKQNILDFLSSRNSMHKQSPNDNVIVLSRPNGVMFSFVYDAENILTPFSYISQASEDDNEEFYEDLSSYFIEESNSFNSYVKFIMDYKKEYSKFRFNVFVQKPLYYDRRLFPIIDNESLMYNIEIRDSDGKVVTILMDYKKSRPFILFLGKMKDLDKFSNNEVVTENKYSNNFDAYINFKEM